MHFETIVCKYKILTCS